MNPGATTRPLASIVLSAVPLTSPTAAILPSAIAIDPWRGGPPRPSMIWAFVIRRPTLGAVAFGDVAEQADTTIATAAIVALRRPAGGAMLRLAIARDARCWPAQPASPKWRCSGSRMDAFLHDEHTPDLQTV